MPNADRGLTEAERVFLERLVPWMGRHAPQHIVPSADRVSDRARQALKKRGLVTYSPNKAPKNCSRWQATDAGRTALTGDARDE